MLSAVPSRKETKDTPDTCRDLILCVKCINIEITKEALCLSSEKLELYLFISSEKEYTMRTGVVEIYFLKKKRIRAIVIYFPVSIKIKVRVKVDKI